MKIRKSKFILSVILAAAVFFGAFAFSACGKNTGYATFLFADGENVTSQKIDMKGFEGKTVYDVLISAKYSNILDADISETSYGAILNSIKNIVPDPNAAVYEYVGLYVSIEEYAGTEFRTEIVVNGITLYSSYEGIGTLPMIKNATYLFKIDIYE